MDYGNTNSNTPSMHRRLGSVTVQLAFPREGNPNFQGEIPFGQYSCKKYKIKKVYECVCVFLSVHNSFKYLQNYDGVSVVV